MKPLHLDDVREYVNENIVDFHRRKIKSLEELRLEKLLTDRFCDSTGAIDWVKLVEFNSGNYDLDEFLP
jgi:hypothetical protein